MFQRSKVGRARPMLVSVLVAASLVVAACGSDEGSKPAPTEAGSEVTEPSSKPTDAPGATDVPPAPTDPPGVEPQAGGTLDFLVQADTRSYDGAKMSTGTLGHLGTFVYDHLLYFDANLAQTPGLALSAVVNDTGDVWTINLRPDVSFTDGTPFDADAVKFHFERVANPETGSPAASAAGQIASIEVIDDVTLEVTLKAPDFTWEYALGQSNPGGALTFVPSPTAVEKFGADYGTSPETTVGAGPFILTEWVTGASSTFVKNDDYWDAPRPYLDQINASVVADETTRFNTFTSAEADVVYNVGTGATMGRLADEYDTGYGPFAGALAMFFNTQSGATADFRIREALAVGSNIQNVLDVISDGTLTWPGFYLSPDSALGNDVAMPAYDPELAAKDVADYLAENGGDKVTIIVRGNQAFTDMLTVMKQDYDQIPGLDVQIQLGPNDETVARQTGRDYENVFMTGSPEDPRTLAGLFRSASPGNLSFVNDPEIDAALGEATGTVDAAARQQALEKLSERFNALLPYFPLAKTLRQWNWADSVHGIEITADGSSRPAGWWIES